MLRIENPQSHFVLQYSSFFYCNYKGGIALLALTVCLQAFSVFLDLLNWCNVLNDVIK